MEDIIKMIVASARRDRSALIPVLQHVQSRFGYVPREAVDAIGHELGVPPSEIYGVLTFYAQFRINPVGRHSIKACRGTACHVRGAPSIIHAIEDELNLDGPQDTTADGEFTFEKIACFGACSLAPVVVLDRDTSGRMTPDRARRLIRKVREKRHQGVEPEARDG